MTITYCRDDSVESRWSGVNRLLTEYEVDYNFYQHESRITTLEGNVTVTVSIAAISQPSASTLLVTMSDGSAQGPFTLPVSTFNDRGAWAPATAYLVNDTFTANGNLYRVLFAHTSAATFDPNANDGAGHDYYAAMLSSPGNALPAGGAAAQILQKSSGADYAVTWGYKLPTGGTAGQVLLKQSATNQDVTWGNIAASAVAFAPSTASGLTSTNVSDALEELAAGGGTGGGGGGSGRQTLWIPAAAMTPLITDGATANTVETSTNKNIIKTLDFAGPSAHDAAQFDLALPSTWDKGDLAFRVFWSHASATVNFGVMWSIYANTFGPDTSLDDLIGDHVNIADTGGTADTLYVSDETDPLTVMDVAATSPIDNSLLVVQVLRVPAAENTLAVDARLHGVQVFYNTI